MDYAIIQLGGKQYRVAEGDRLIVDKLDSDLIKSGKVNVSDVLFVRQGDKISVGQPFVDGAKVTLEHVQDQKGKKMRIFKYKAKSRYRRTYGHRQHESVFQVKNITA